MSIVVVAAATSSCLRKDTQKGELAGVLAKVGDQRLVIEDLEGHVDLMFLKVLFELIVLVWFC